MHFLSLLLLLAVPQAHALGSFFFRDVSYGTTCRPSSTDAFFPGLTGTWKMPTNCTTAQVSLRGAGGGGGGLGDSTVGSCLYGHSGGGQANSPDYPKTDYGLNWDAGVADAYLKNGATTVAQAATGKGGHGGDSDSCTASIGGAAGTSAGTVANIVSRAGAAGGSRGTPSGTCWTISATAGDPGDWVYGSFSAASGTTFNWLLGDPNDDVTFTLNAGWSFDANCVGSVGGDPSMVISWPAYR